MSKKKYNTECSVLLCSSTCIMLPPDQLARDAEMPENIEHELSHCHIYLICSRPALAIDPATFVFSKNECSGHLVRKVDGQDERIQFNLKLEVPDGGAIRLSAYPHRQLEFIEAGGEIARVTPVAFLPAALFANSPDENGLTKFSVEYVGQSYAGGNRSAFERLKSHSTLQKILADFATSRPDDEVMLFLFRYPPYAVSSILGSDFDINVGQDEDEAHFERIIDTPIDEKHQISMVEAGLIRYFQPYYNDHYKKHFPHKRQRLLNDCYHLDFAALVVEIDTEDVSAQIGTDSVGWGMHHIASFDLHDAKERRSFFTLRDSTGRDTIVDVSGPTF